MAKPKRCPLCGYSHAAGEKCPTGAGKRGMMAPPFVAKPKTRGWKKGS